MTRGFIGNKVPATDITNRSVLSVNTNGVVPLDDIYNAMLLPNTWDKAAAHPLYTPNIGGKTTAINRFNTGQQTAIGFYVSSDGTLLFMMTAFTIYKYTLSTPYDLSTATLSKATVMDPWSLTSGVTWRGFTFNQAGTKLYAMSSNGVFMVINLSSAWDITTSPTSYSALYTWNSLAGDNASITWSGDGSSLYIVGGISVSAPILMQMPCAPGSPFNLAASPSPTGSLTMGQWGDFTGSVYPAITPNLNGSGFVMSNAASLIDKYLITITNTQPSLVSDSSTTITGKFSTLDAINGWGYGQATTLDTVQPVMHMQFANSGMFLYVLSSGTIYRIRLAKAYSLESYQPSSNFALLKAVRTGTGLFIKPDGTKMYTTDTTTDIVYQYSLGTAWDVSTATLDITKRALLTQDGTANALAFKDDGLVMYMIGASTGRVYQYTLSTAWDVSTATYASKSLLVTGSESTPTGMCFSDTGGTLFIVGEGGDAIASFELSTAWDISTAVGPFLGSSTDTSPMTFCFGDDGSKFYYVGFQRNRIYQFNCNAPYNLRTIASSTGQYTLTSIVNEALSGANTTYANYRGLSTNSTGTQFYVFESVSKTVYALDLGTAWDISTATYNNKQRNISDIELTPTTVTFNVDGTRMYVSGTTSDNIVEYVLSTGWDITTARRITTVEPLPFLYSGTTLESAITELEFSNTGSSAYLMGTTNDRIYQFPLSTSYDLGTIQLPYNYKYYRPTTSQGNMCFSPDGTKMFWLSQTGDIVYQYTLTTAWDVSTAVYDNISFSPTTGGAGIVQSVGATALAFKSDGKRMYLVGTTSDLVYQYDLLNPWSIATPFYANTGGVNYTNTTRAPLDTAPSGISFDDTGTRMFIIGTTSDQVRTYSLKTAWDVTTADYRRFSNPGDEATVTCASYNDDGTRLYVLGTTTNKVYQYTLGTAYDPSSGPYASQGAGLHTGVLDVSAVATGATDFFFKPDGTALYILASSRILYQYTLSTAWNISTGTYSNKSYNLSARDTAGTYIAFSNDGTKLYFGGTTSDTISRHALTTAWDIATASFETAQTKSVVAQDTTMQSLTFKPDGTRAFMLGATADRMFQYDLTTAWDITTLTYNNVSANVAHMTATGASVTITSDGTKLLIADGSGNVWPATLTTAWDLSTLASDTLKPTLTQTTLATSLAFSANGGKMYTTAANAVFEYTLNRSWLPDSAAATVTGINPTTALVASETAVTGIAFTANGTTMYMAGSTSDAVHQLTLGTAWTTNTATYPLATQQKTLSLAELTGTGMRFTANGSLMYLVGTTNDTIYKYTLSTPWDISTASSTQTFLTNSLPGGSVADPLSVDISSDGLSLYVTTASLLVQYRMTTAHDLSTISAPRLLISAQDAAVAEHRFSADGTKLFVLGPTTTMRVLQTTLTQAWRPSTAGVWTSFTFTEDTAPTSFDFSSDGTKMYVLGTTNDTVYQYTLATAWDITTASYASKSVSIAGQEIVGTGLIFGDSGTKMYVVGSTSDNIRQYNLSTAWDVSTATYSNKTLSILAQDTTSSSLFFKPDGTRVFIVGTTGDIVRGYNLSTAWDISTGVYSAALDKSIVVQDTTSSGLTFSSDGTRMFMNGTTNDYIYTYILGTAWDPSTSYPDVFVIPATSSSMKFNSAGTKLNVIANAGNSMIEYTVSTPWEVGKITSNTVTSLLTQFVSASPGGQGFAFNDTGSKLMVISANSTLTAGRMITYDLSTAYTTNTASQIATATLRTPFPDTAPVSIQLSANGTKMILTGNTTTSLYEYTLSANGRTQTATLANTVGLPIASYIGTQVTANNLFIMRTTGAVAEYYTPTTFSLTGLTFARDKSVASEDTTPAGVFFKSDGLKAYVMGRASSAVKEYTLTTAYQLGTASYTRQFSVSSQTTDATDVFFKSDGTRMYVISNTNKAVYQYTLATAWDVSTATYATTVSTAGIDDTGYSAITLSKDGRYLYVVSGTSYNIYRFTLGTAFDLSTASSTYQTLYVGDRATPPNSITFSSDGKQMYLTLISPGARVIRYTLNTPWDLSTATYVELRALTNPRAYNVSDDGKTFVSFNGTSVVVSKFTSNTAWTLANHVSRPNYFLRSFTSNTSTSTNTTFATGTNTVKAQQFITGGEYVLTLVQDTTTTGANTYHSLQIRNMSEPYSPNGSFDAVRTVPLTTDNTTPLNIGGMTTTSDGTKLYIVDNQTFMVYQFDRI